MGELEGKIEAILFASADYVPTDKLMALTGASKKEVAAALDELSKKYEQLQSAITLTQENNSWKLAVKTTYMPAVKDLIKNTELTKSVMETLAVIAWKSPINQADVIKIRTNKAYDHIAELMERGFVVKEKSGRTYALKLTQKFYDYFDMSSRQQIQEMFDGAEQKAQQKAILPQRKVIDFDGTPRETAKIPQDMKIEVYSVETHEEVKKQRADEIKNLMGSHTSALDELDKRLQERSAERSSIVDDIRSNLVPNNNAADNPTPGAVVVETEKITVTTQPQNEEKTESKTEEESDNKKRLEDSL